MAATPPRANTLLANMQIHGTWPSPFTSPKSDNKGETRGEPAALNFDRSPAARVAEAASPVQKGTRSRAASSNASKKSSGTPVKSTTPVRSGKSTTPVKLGQPDDADPSPAPTAAKGKAKNKASETKTKATAKPKSKAEAKAKLEAESTMGPPKPVPKGQRRGKKVNPCPVPLDLREKKMSVDWEPVKEALPPKREEDNYELSDREDNGDTADDIDRSHKKIPAWCQSMTNLVQEQGNVDPDSIFGPSVPICDLDEIFPDMLYRKLNLVMGRKRPRDSDWTRDRLRKSEVSGYARLMGQNRRLSKFCRKLSLAKQRA